VPRRFVATGAPLHGCGSVGRRDAGVACRPLRTTGLSVGGRWRWGDGMKSARLPGFRLVTLAGTSSSGRRGGFGTGKGRTARVPAIGAAPLAAVGRAVRRLDAATSMVDAEARVALDRRWAGLPERARVPEQVVGKAFIGCEGTHGVFPRCNFTCSPCYHSSDANHVRVDGGHTRAAVEQQMGLLRSTRGPHAHAQLIGGEVSLLDADDHAAALQVMEGFGRVPMSFTHGDFDYDYLERIVLDAHRRPRLSKISFAAHFDITMRGRRSVPRPRTEAGPRSGPPRFLRDVRPFAI